VTLVRFTSTLPFTPNECDVLAPAGDGIQFLIDQVSVIESELLPTGSRYRVLHQIKLAAGH